MHSDNNMHSVETALIYIICKASWDSTIAAELFRWEFAGNTISVVGLYFFRIMDSR